MTDTTENKAKSTPSQKLAWGFGGFAENLGINVVPSLAYNIFQIGMGISPFIIGLALSASRIIEGVTDPIIGNWSDNTESKWGRRRPWIFVGSIIISLIFVSIWFTPRTGSTFLGVLIQKDSLIQSAYLIATVSLFFMSFAIWQIPFSALGLELEEDYDERTKLQQYKLYFSYIVGTAIGSLYLLAQMNTVWGGDEITGARYLGIIIGVVMLISGMLPAIICKERYRMKSTHQKIKFFPALMATFKDAPFRLLMGAIFFVFLSLFFMLPLLGYISMYHVCKDGMHTVVDWSWRSPFSFHLMQKYLTHKELSGIMGALGAVIQTTAQILSVVLITRISKYFDKKTILMAGLVVCILGYLSSWFLFTPELPYLSMAPPIIINMGLCTCWVLIGSFSADICDYDEMKTGMRREGMFSAVTGFLIKLSIAAVIAISSWVLIQLGIDGADPKLSTEQLFTLRWFYIAVPVTALVIAIIFMLKYPLSKAKVAEIQEQLAINRAK